MILNSRYPWLTSALLLGATVAQAQQPDAKAKIGPAKADENGFLAHPVDSELQAGPTEIKMSQHSHRQARACGGLTVFHVESRSQRQAGGILDCALDWLRGVLPR